MILNKTTAFAFAFMLIAAGSYAQDADIKKMIDNESEAWSKKDITSWQSNWLQDPGTSRAFVGGQGYFTTMGWDSIKARTTRNFARNPEPDSATRVTDSFLVRKDGNMAVVDYKQTLNYKVMPPFNQFVSWEHRVLVKKNGQWKIAKQVSTDLTAYGANGTELLMNLVGYTYLQQGKTDQAIEVLALNVKLFPNSFNVFDSLGEAYAAAGQKDQAIEQYKKSLELNPDNDSAKKALQTLQK